jgi:polyphosphate kinase
MRPSVTPLRKPEEPGITFRKLNGPRRFLDGDLSCLELSRRGLEEAENPCHPLLSRVRFLSISAANLGEFLMFCLADLYNGIEWQSGSVQPRVGCRRWIISPA